MCTCIFVTFKNNKINDHVPGQKVLLYRVVYMYVCMCTCMYVKLHVVKKKIYVTWTAEVVAAATLSFVPMVNSIF